MNKPKGRKETKSNQLIQGKRLQTQTQNGLLQSVVLNLRFIFVGQ